MESDDNSRRSMNKPDQDHLKGEVNPHTLHEPWLQRLLNRQTNPLPVSHQNLSERVIRRIEAPRIWNPGDGAETIQKIGSFANDIVNRFSEVGSRFLPGKIQQTPHEEPELVFIPGMVGLGGLDFRIEETLEPADFPQMPPAAAFSPSNKPEIGKETNISVGSSASATPQPLDPRRTSPSLAQRRAGVRPMSKVEEITPRVKGQPDQVPSEHSQADVETASPQIPPSIQQTTKQEPPVETLQQTASQVHPEPTISPSTEGIPEETLEPLPHSIDPLAGKKEPEAHSVLQPSHSDTTPLTTSVSPDQQYSALRRESAEPPLKDEHADKTLDTQKQSIPEPTQTAANLGDELANQEPSTIQPPLKTTTQPSSQDHLPLAVVREEPAPSGDEEGLSTHQPTAKFDVPDLSEAPSVLPPKTLIQPSSVDDHQELAGPHSIPEEAHETEPSLPSEKTSKQEAPTAYSDTVQFLPLPPSISKSPGIQREPQKPQDGQISPLDVLEKEEKELSPTKIEHLTQTSAQMKPAEVQRSAQTTQEGQSRQPEVGKKDAKDPLPAKGEHLTQIPTEMRPAEVQRSAELDQDVQLQPPDLEIQEAAQLEPHKVREAGEKPLESLPLAEPAAEPQVSFSAPSDDLELDEEKPYPFDRPSGLPLDMPLDRSGQQELPDQVEDLREATAAPDPETPVQRELAPPTLKEFAKPSRIEPDAPVASSSLDNLGRETVLPIDRVDLELRIRPMKSPQLSEPSLPREAGDSSTNLPLLGKQSEESAPEPPHSDHSQVMRSIKTEPAPVQSDLPVASSDFPLPVQPDLVDSHSQETTPPHKPQPQPLPLKRSIETSSTETKDIKGEVPSGPDQILAGLQEKLDRSPDSSPLLDTSNSQEPQDLPPTITNVPKLPLTYVEKSTPSLIQAKPAEIPYEPEAGQQIARAPLKTLDERVMARTGALTHLSLKKVRTAPREPSAVLRKPAVKDFAPHAPAETGTKEILTLQEQMDPTIQEGLQPASSMPLSRVTYPVVKSGYPELSASHQSRKVSYTVPEAHIQRWREADPLGETAPSSEPPALVQRALTDSQDDEDLSQEIDLDDLARKVYPLIRRKIAIERERRTDHF
jgi:hypothetical protein